LRPGTLGEGFAVGVLGRTLREYKRNDLTDWAAALTYYSVLSLFPGLLVLVALLGLVGQHPETTDALLRIVESVGPRGAVETFQGPIQGVITNKSGAGALLGLGLLGALWSASGYVGAFMRASNVIYSVDQRRFWKQRPLQLVITLVMALALAVVAVAIVLTGPLAEAVGGVIGLGDTTLTIWNIAKWPVLLVVIITMISTLYFLAPNVRRPYGYRWITAGGLLAVLLWLVASAAFALYVANFASYNKTYGTLGGVIVFLVWLYISNNALLVGAVLDAEIERTRELEAGLPAEETHQLPQRDVRA